VTLLNLYALYKKLLCMYVCSSGAAAENKPMMPRDVTKHPDGDQTVEVNHHASGDTTVTDSVFERSSSTPEP